MSSLSSSVSSKSSKSSSLSSSSSSLSSSVSSDSGSSSSESASSSASLNLSIRLSSSSLAVTLMPLDLHSFFSSLRFISSYPSPSSSSDMPIYSYTSSNGVSFAKASKSTSPVMFFGNGVGFPPAKTL